MSLSNFTQVERVCGSPCWLHNEKHIWVVEYSKARARPRHFVPYRAVQPVPKGRQPWTVDNRRIGSDDGFETLEAAAHAGETA